MKTLGSGMRNPWSILLALAVFYIILELYYFYRPPPLITRLPEYGFPDFLGYAYKMLLLVALLWTAASALRNPPPKGSGPFYALLSLGTLGAPLAIRMTLSVYSYTNYTAVFTLVALLFAFQSHTSKEPLLPRAAALTASLLGVFFIALPTLYYQAAKGLGDPGLDALLAFLTITPLSTAASLSMRGRLAAWPAPAAYGLLALATAGYSLVAEPLQGALEKPLAAASIFVSMQSLSFLLASGGLLARREGGSAGGWS